MRLVDNIFNSVLGKGETKTYTLYDYLESDGRKQYIDTGMIVGGDCSIEIDALWLGQISGNDNDYIAGARNASNNNEYFMRAQNSKFKLRYYSEIDGYNGIIYQHYYSYQRHRNDITIYDGDTVVYHATPALRTSASSYNHCLFAYNNAGDIFTSPFKKRLGVVRIYDSNGVLVRDFHPAVRNSDGVAGMHDVVNDVFYTNANPAGDNFLYGNLT